MQERISELECRIAFYEDLLESLNTQVAQLNIQLAKQQEIIIEICKELQEVKKSSSIIGGYSLREEIPPHY